MNDQIKTKEQLIDELQELRQKVAELQELGQPRQTEETLQAQALRRAWFDNVADPIFIFDQETKRFLDCNQATIDRYGYTLEELRTMTPHQLHPPEELEIVERNIDDRDDFSPHYYTHITKDGTRLQVEILTNEIEYDGRDAWLSITRDITERKRIEDALRESEEKYRAILENIEEGYFEVDLAGNFTFLNDTLSDFLGYPPEELMGLNYRQYVGKENVRKVFQTFNTVYRTGEPAQVFDWEVIKKDGERRLVESSVSLIHDFTGAPIGFRGIVRDVTGHRQAEIEREQLLTVLEHRGTQLQTAAEVSRAVGSILDPEALVPQVVDLVRERFGLYYAGLFLVDQTGEWTGEPNKWAVLRAGTGEAGRQMLRQGHKLEIGGSSMIGWCIANKQARITLDVGEDAVRFDNPHLPNTRSELALPLISRGRPIGALTIQSDQEAAFTKEDIAALQTMGDQMANAIANARLYDQAHREINERKRAEELTRRRAAQTTLVYEVGKRLIGELELEPLLSEIVTAVYEAFDYYNVMLLLFDEETLRLSLHSIAGGYADVFPADLSFAVGESIIGRVAATGKPQISGDVDRDSHYRPIAGVATKSELSVPIKSGQKTIGVLDLQSNRFNAFDETDVMIMETMADQITIAIKNARLFEALQKALEELEKHTYNLERQTTQLQVGAEVAREAAAIRDVQQLLNTAVRLISDRFGFYHAGVFLIDEMRQHAVLRAASSEGGQRMLARGHKLPIGKVGIVGYVAATGESRVALDVDQDDVHFAHDDLPDTRSEMSLPLNVRDRTIGVLDVQSREPDPFSDSDVAVLQTLADQLAVAIDNAHLAERTEAQLRELSLFYGQYSSSLGAELASPERSIGYVYDRIGVVSSENLSVPALDVALTRGETVALAERASPATASTRGGGLTKWEATSGTEGEKMLATPLKLHDQIIGSLGIQESDRSREWSLNEIALIEAVSDQVALALENAQHFAETQRSAQQLQILNELARSLTARLTVQEVLEETYQGVSRLLDTANFYIAFHDPETNTISFPLAVENAQRVQWSSRQAGNGLTEYVIRNREPVLIPKNVTGWLEEKGIEVIGAVALSWLGAPLILGDQVLGAIAVQSATTPQAYDQRDRDLLTAIASQTAIALQNARLFRETETALAETKALYRVGEIISRLGELEGTLQSLAYVLVEQLGYTSAWLALVDKQTQTLNGIAGAGVSENWIKAQIPLDGQLCDPAVQSVLNRSPIVINDVAADERAADMSEKARAFFGRLLEIPILIGIEAEGIIAVSRSKDMPEISKRDVEVLQAVADQAAVAVQNIRLLGETERRAERERLIHEITSKIRRSPNVSTILQTAVEELGQALQTDRALVRLMAKSRHRRSAVSEVAETDASEAAETGRKIQDT